jgi:hypothetical protein
MRVQQNLSLTWEEDPVSEYTSLGERDLDEDPEIQMRRQNHQHLFRQRSWGYCPFCLS